ncbi:unnamed protein product, partial [Ectocarpus sp. 13 AM-2016]
GDCPGGTRHRPRKHPSGQKEAQGSRGAEGAPRAAQSHGNTSSIILGALHGGAERGRAQRRVQLVRVPQRRRLLRSRLARPPQGHLEAHQWRHQLQREGHGGLHGGGGRALRRPHQHAGRARADAAVVGVRKVLPDQVRDHDGGGAAVAAQPRKGQAEGGLGELRQPGLHQSPGVHGEGVEKDKVRRQDQDDAGGNRGRGHGTRQDPGVRLGCACCVRPRRLMREHGTGQRRGHVQGSKTNETRGGTTGLAGGHERGGTWTLHSSGAGNDGTSAVAAQVQQWHIGMNEGGV